MAGNENKNDLKKQIRFMKRLWIILGLSGIFSFNFDTFSLLFKGQGSFGVFDVIFISWMVFLFIYIIIKMRKQIIDAKFQDSRRTLIPFLVASLGALIPDWISAYSNYNLIAFFIAFSISIIIYTIYCLKIMFRDISSDRDINHLSDEIPK